jgi:cyclin T
MLELYEQNRVGPPPSQGNDTEGSASVRAPVKEERAPVKEERAPVKEERAPVKEERAPVKEERASVKEERASVKEEPPANETHQAPRQSSIPGRHGYDHPHPEKQNSNQRIPKNEARDGSANSNEGTNMSSSMMDAMKKIDKDKVKAALEKRRKSKGDAGRKIDVMDDDDLIERELEHGIELAAEDEKKHDRRQSWPHPSHRVDHQNTARKVENTEEGELSMDSQDYRSPDPDNRKRRDAHEHKAYDRGSERDLKRLRS